MRVRFLTPALCLAGALGAAGCGHGATACKVVDAAHEACAVIKYLGPDGEVRQVRVTQEELQQFGQEVASKRAAAAKEQKQ